MTEILGKQSRNIIVILFQVIKEEIMVSDGRIELLLELRVAEDLQKVRILLLHHCGHIVASVNIVADSQKTEVSRCDRRNLAECASEVADMEVSNILRDVYVTEYAESILQLTENKGIIGIDLCGGVFRLTSALHGTRDDACGTLRDKGVFKVVGKDIPAAGERLERGISRNPSVLVAPVQIVVGDRCPLFGLCQGYGA